MRVKALNFLSYDYREFDRIIISYTYELGKIEILVRGARKSTSKLVFFTSNFFGLFLLYLERGRNFYHLIGGKILKQFKGINSNYKKIFLLRETIKKLNEIIKFEKPEPKIFELLLKTLEKIDSNNLYKTEIFISAFLIKFLALSGHKPELKRCLFCQREIKEGKVFFDFSKGGIICLNCEKKDVTGEKINFSILKILQNLLYQDYETIEKKFFNSIDFIKAKNIIDNFIKWQFN
jgi:DNA repair protein RecO (recombination protein O)